MTCSDVEKMLRSEMVNLSLKQLKQFAIDMGVDVDTKMGREEIEDACVNAELYAFAH